MLDGCPDTCVVGLCAQDGMEPLHKACQQGDAELARRLLEQGAPLDVPDRVSDAPIYIPHCTCHVLYVCIYTHGSLYT